MADTPDHGRTIRLQPQTREQRLEALSQLAAQQQAKSGTHEDAAHNTLPKRASLAPSHPTLPFWRRVPFWLAIIVLLGVAGAILWHLQVQSLQPVSPTACSWSTTADATGTLWLGPPSANRVSGGSYTVILQQNTCNQHFWQATGIMTITGTNMACANGIFTLDLESDKESVETTKAHVTIGNAATTPCADGSQVMANTVSFENSQSTTAMCAELQNIYWVDPAQTIQAGSDCR